MSGFWLIVADGTRPWQFGKIGVADLPQARHRDHRHRRVAVQVIVGEIGGGGGLDGPGVFELAFEKKVADCD